MTKGRNKHGNFQEVARSFEGRYRVGGVEQDTYSAAEAAKVLGVSRRQVLNYLHDGTLEGFREEEGGAWKLFQWSVHSLRDIRPAAKSPSEAAERPQEALQYQTRIEELARELGRLEGRLELTEMAESTLREQLERERERADRLEEQLEAERSKGFWARLFGG
jgi:hypothetical protein